MRRGGGGGEFNQLRLRRPQLNKECWTRETGHSGKARVSGGFSDSPVAAKGQRGGDRYNPSPHPPPKREETGSKREETEPDQENDEGTEAGDLRP